MKSNRLPAVIVIPVALVFAVLPLLTPAIFADEEEAGEGITVITSERLTFDYKNNHAVFEHDVVVVDRNMRLTGDRLAVWFNEEGEISSIRAEGNVFITQDGKIASAGEATYQVAEGKIVLEKTPRLQRGLHILEGTTITYWRDEERLVVEPNSVLKIFPGSDGGSLNVFGD